VNKKIECSPLEINYLEMRSQMELEDIAQEAENNARRKRDQESVKFDNRRIDD